MSRIYVVTTTIAANDNHGALEEHRLVKADNPAQARNFVTRDTVSVKYAEQQDIVDLIEEGTSVEDATDPNAPQPTLPGV